MCPRRQDAGEVIVATRVRVNIGLHVDAVLAGVVDQLDDLVHAAPVQLVGNLDVEDLHCDARAPADLDDLADGVEDAGALVANMSDEDAAMPGHHLAQLDHVVGRRQRIGRHRQHAREPAGALLHRLVDQRSHLVELRRRRPLVRIAHDGFPDVAQADKRRDVGGHAGSLPEIEVSAQGGPLLRLPLDREHRRSQLAPVGTGRAAFAQDLGGDALANLALGIAVFEQREVGMRMDVNEAGCHDQTAGVNLAFAGAGRDASEGRDFVAPDGQIAVPPGIAAAIDNLAVADDQIVKGVLVLRRFGEGHHGGEDDWEKNQ